MSGLRRCGWFWAAVPVGGAAVLGFLVLGLLGLLPALLFGWMLLSRPTARSSAFGLVAGAGLPLIYTAYAQRDGPGTTCWHTATASGCDQHLNPLPWLVAGLLLLLGGLTAQARHG